MKENKTFNLISYNIKLDYESRDEPEDHWDNRKNHVVNLLHFHKAHLFGLQEALPNQVEYLISRFPDYDWIGESREGGRTKGEFVPIFFKKELFELEDGNTFWISEKPKEPTIGWDAAFPRICTWAKLLFKPLEKYIYFFNTHLDHKGSQARNNGTDLLLKKIKEIGNDAPVVLSGDFNDEEDSYVYKHITANGLIDAKSISKTGLYGPRGTFNGFEFHEKILRRIDFIFLNNKLNVCRYGHLTDSCNLHYPSDHLPIMAEVGFS